MAIYSVFFSILAHSEVMERNMVEPQVKGRNMVKDLVTEWNMVKGSGDGTESGESWKIR